MFEMRPTADLIQIASAGGAVEMDAGMRPTPDLIQIASAAARGGGTFIFRKMEMRPAADLIQISSAGKGHVRFA
jgi:hypothetical protein